MKLSEIARLLECELRGEDIEISGVAGIEDAGPGELTFVSNPKYVRSIASTTAGAIILGPDSGAAAIPTLVADNPYLAFARAIELFYQPPEPLEGIHPAAVVAPSARLGCNCSVGAYAVISDNVQIGDRATLHPHVVIYPEAAIGDDFTAHSGACVRERVRIGHRVILQNGAVVGADGFGFAPDEEGVYHKMVQSGIVVLEDDVEIGANTCVDRSTIGETRIGRGTKLDNLVQIGHGSRVGRHNVLAAQAGLAGSTKVGDHTMLGGQVGVAGHLDIGDRVIATAQTGIARSVEEGKVVSGTPEMESGLWKKNYLLMHEFPELVKTLKRLEKRVAELEANEADSKHSRER